MRKKIWYVSAFGFVIVCALGVAYWQFLELGRGIRTMPTNKAEELLVGSLSSQVLAPSVEANEAQADRTKPILDEYRANPALTHQRYLQVITWVHASKLATAIATAQPDNEIVDSASLTNTPPEDRLDGWGQPYCVLIDLNRIAVLSSAGSGTMDCKSLHEFAQRVADLSTDARLAKQGNFLVTVQQKGK